jgi:hypothetical protein
VVRDLTGQVQAEGVTRSCLVDALFSVQKNFTHLPSGLNTSTAVFEGVLMKHLPLCRAEVAKLWGIVGPLGRG